MGKVVCIGGLIAAGKTTFIRQFKKHIETKGLKVKSLPEIYTDGVRELIHTHLPAGDAFMMAHRLQMGIDANEIARLYDIILMERSFIDHLAFIEAFEQTGKLDSQIASLYRQIIEEVLCPKPDHYIYLDIKPTLSIERRKSRASGENHVFTLDFLVALEKAYSQLIPSFYTNALYYDWTHFGEEVCKDDLLEKILPSLLLPTPMK